VSSQSPNGSVRALCVTGAIAAVLGACGPRLDDKQPTPPPPKVTVVPDAAPELPPEPPITEARAIPSAPAPAVYQPVAIDIEVRGTGRPIIFVPGLGCAPSVFDATIAHLGAGKVQAHLVSFAGYAGKPALGKDRPLLATARIDLAAYIRDRKLDKPIIVGHSLGGFMAFWLAATEPGLVGGVVNLDATPNYYTDSSPANLRAKADKWLAMGKAQFTDTLVNYFNPMSGNRPRIEATIAQVIKSDQRAFVESFMEMSRQNIVPIVGKIDVPVLSILADSAYFKEYVAGQTRALPRHKIVMLPGTRHFVFFDDPAAYYRTLDSFLSSIPR